MLKINVYHSTIRKRLNKIGLFGRRPLFPKRNMATRLRFAKLYLNRIQDFENNVLWRDTLEVQKFGHNLSETKQSMSAQTSRTRSLHGVGQMATLAP